MRGLKDGVEGGKDRSTVIVQASGGDQLRDEGPTVIVGCWKRLVIARKPIGSIS